MSDAFNGLFRDSSSEEYKYVPTKQKCEVVPFLIDKNDVVRHWDGTFAGPETREVVNRWRKK